MKIFTNKKVWQKIVLVMLILLLMQFFIGKPAHAIDGDVLLEPITSLFANLGDGIMNIMQQTIMGMDSSGAWVEKSDNSFWIKLAIIAVAIAAAVVSVIAIVYTGGAALAVLATSVGAVLKIAGVAVAVYFAASIVHFGENGFFLPEYELTPQTIFKNEVLAFDVNFFNPMADKVKTTITSTMSKDDYNIEYEGLLYQKDDTSHQNPDRVLSQLGTTTFKLSNTTPESIGENYARTARENYKKDSYR